MDPASFLSLKAAVIGSSILPLEAFSSPPFLAVFLGLPIVPFLGTAVEGLGTPILLSTDFYSTGAPLPLRPIVKKNGSFRSSLGGLIYVRMFPASFRCLIEAVIGSLLS